MLGKDMLNVFADMDVVALGQSDLDVTDQERVFETFMSIQPDVVINCTGYTNVDDAEKHEEQAMEINGYAVGVLARGCREIDATFVHMSTDYVFRGEKKSGYNEEDGTNPVNVYGKSKTLGEQLIFDEMESINNENPKEGRYFLIRTSWLFGKHGRNFVEAMLEAGQARDTVKVVDDQHGKPTYTIDLCEQVKWLITSHEYPSGIYHITNEGATTWFQFAKKIFQLSNMKTRVVPCGSIELRRPARRPKYSILKNNALPKLRPWEEALQDYLANR